MSLWIISNILLFRKIWAELYKWLTLNIHVEGRHFICILCRQCTFYFGMKWSIVAMQLMSIKASNYNKSTGSEQNCVLFVCLNAQCSMLIWCFFTVIFDFVFSPSSQCTSRMFKCSICHTNIVKKVYMYSNRVSCHYAHFFYLQIIVSQYWVSWISFSLPIFSLNFLKYAFYWVLYGSKI